MLRISSASPLKRRPRHAAAAVRGRPGRSRPRAGLSVVLVVIIMVALIGFVSLAIDVGRVWLARAGMQTAADAAARAGALSLPISTQSVIDQASDAALRNPVIDTEREDSEHLRQRTNPGVELYPEEDVIFGIWHPVERTFTPIEDRSGTEQDERRRANALHVHGRRNHDRGNALRLIFGPVIGVFRSDVERDAIAYVTGGPANFGFVGIDWVESNGDGANIQSMVYGKDATGGGVASDGDIDLGNGDVYGDARPGIGHELIQGPNSQATGWTANLDYKLKDLYPSPSLGDIPDSATVVNPPNNKDWSLPTSGPPSHDPENPRHFRINGDLDKVKTLTVNGYVKLWVNGDVDLMGNTVVNLGNPPVPAKIEIIVIGNNRTVDIGGNAVQYMHLYAPDANVIIHGTPGYYGWAVGKTLSFLGTSALYYDESRNRYKPFDIMLVK